MRILIYSINYAPEPTSTGKYAGELAAWLARRGHEVDAVAPLPHYPQWQIYPEYRGKGFFGFHSEQLEDVNVLRTPIYVPDPKRVVGTGRRMLYELSFTTSARWYFFWRTIARRRYDVIIPICPPVQLGWSPWCYHLLRRTPWVFHIQDLQVDAAVRLGMLNPGLVTKLMYRFEGFMLRHASAVSTITEPMRQRVIERGRREEDTWLVPNWANLDDVKPGERDNAFRRELGLEPNHLLFMYAGNLGAKQGLEVVLDAADRLRDDRRIRFAIIGSGAAQARLAAKAVEMKLANLQLQPVQPMEKLNDMLAAADVHLVAQRREAADLVMPSKLTNILAAGRPCIATADPETALGSILREQDAGLACEPDNAHALAAAIGELAGDDERRERMGYNARRYAEQALSQDTILQDFETRLQALVNAKGRNKPPSDSTRNSS